MRKVSVILLCVVALAAAACFKEVAFRTDCIVRPLREATSDDRVRALIPDAVAYAFDADTAAWTVASYDDALNGIIASRSRPSEKRSDPFSVSVPCDDGAIRLDLDREWQMVVVVDPVDKLYAYTRKQIPVNLPTLDVSLIFQPWKPGRSYKYGDWLFFNDFYVEPLRLACFVDPRAQSAEGAEPEAVEQVKIYAYAADTTEWRIASYADAAEGIITSKSSGAARTSPDFPAYADGDSGLYSFEAEASTLMLVAVDRTHRIYAYTKAEVDLAGSSPVFSLLFRPWQELWSVEEEGWRFVDERYAPAGEEPATDMNR